jgi:hypothetical protein
MSTPVSPATTPGGGRRGGHASGGHAGAPLQASHATERGGWSA